MPLAFVGVVVLAAFAGPAHAQVFTQDSVVGHGTGGLSYHSFDVTATSGPSGENPTGEVSLSLFDGRIFASGPVTCLAVTGQRAVIGFSDEGGQQAGQVIVEVEDLGGPGSGLDTIKSSAGTGRAPGDCSPLTSGLFAHVDSGDIVVTDARPARMVGKGAVNGIPGGAASYAYIVGCYAPANTGAPFEVRFGGQRFRLSDTAAVECSDDPTVSSPVGSFDTQVGTGTGTLTSGGPGTMTWRFVDGGSGGAKDSARIQIVNSAGTIIFQGVGAPPGKFPGSTQTTGFNTAQLLP